jgi:hypothetical protein
LGRAVVDSPVCCVRAGELHANARLGRPR